MGGASLPATHAGAAEGRPLILIEEHLTDNTKKSGGYREVNASGRLMEGWFCPSEWTGPGESGFTPVLKIQPFRGGGYEATVRMLDLAKIGRAVAFGGRRKGARGVPDQLSEENRRKAGIRARRVVRLLVKNMAATNLLTFTRRETLEDVEAGRSWGAEDWARGWDKLRRNMERVLGDFPYVAVLEQHKKGNYHLHVAWCGKFPLTRFRPLWWSICGGRGQGNVQSQYIKQRTGCARAAVIARYISKYVTKNFETVSRFNKKRYWASKQSLEQVRRYILRSPDVVQAFSELPWLGVRFADRHNFFLFPDGTGWWWNFIPEDHGADPPF